MVSIERIVDYSKIESEPMDDGLIPLDDWPSSGRIVLSHVSMNYPHSGCIALTDIEAHIEPGERIGIVGRTGAGKSSLIRALFRLTEPDGQIFIDGYDTKTISLKVLRSKLTIIPQDPYLFAGSLRQNLDPFEEHSDEEIWRAITAVELRSAVYALFNGLDTKVYERGGNFSVGQRQLICLARAVLRRAKILIIDEATANVDPSTNASIQNTIRKLFSNCTILTVAHRLNTIIDSDRVMIFENGSLVEFDHPYKLLRSKKSIFSRLVSESGKENAKSLRRLAIASYMKLMRKSAQTRIQQREP